MYYFAVSDVAAAGAAVVVAVVAVAAAGVVAAAVLDVVAVVGRRASCNTGQGLRRRKGARDRERSETGWP